MHDPLAQAIALLRPQASTPKIARGAGAWRIRRPGSGRMFCCAVLEGACRFSHRDGDPVVISEGDFILMPAADDYEMASVCQTGRDDVPARPRHLPNGEFMLGSDDGGNRVRLLIAYGELGAHNKALLSLLPHLIRVHRATRLTRLLELIVDELAQAQPLRDRIVEGLTEVLFLEALRAPGQAERIGRLAQGLADNRIAIALRLMHANVGAAWSVGRLAKEAGLSRSAFFARFREHLGTTPMDYLLHWRMTLAQDLLARHPLQLSEVARQVGYGSATAFGVAFTRYVGMPPSVFAKRA